MADKKLIKLYQRGYSLRAIGIELSKSHEWVRNNLPEKMIRHRKKNVVDYDAVVSFYKKTFSSKETASEFNITRNWVYIILDDYGITTDKRKKLKRSNDERKRVKRTRPAIRS